MNINIVIWYLFINIILSSSEYLCRVGDVKIVTYIPLQPAGHSSLAYLLPKPVCLAMVVRNDTQINVTLSLTLDIKR